MDMLEKLFGSVVKVKLMKLFLFNSNSIFDKKDVQGYLGLARIAEKQGRGTDAIALYKEIMRMEGVPANIKVIAQGYLGLARVAEKQGRWSDAIALYREILRMEEVPPNIKVMANERIRLLE